MVKAKMPIEKKLVRQKGFFETPADASAKETFDND
jgi:hypothetical protein